MAKTYEITPAGQSTTGSTPTSPYSSDIALTPGQFDATQPVVGSNAANTVFSTEKAVGTVQDKQDSLSKLSGETPASTSVPETTPTTETPPAKTETPPQTEVTLINPDTGQTVTFKDAVINKGNVQAYLQSGYQLESANGAIPDWLQPGGVSTTPEADTLQQQYDKANETVDNLIASMDSFKITDAELNSTIEGIKSTYASRKNDMERINASRTGALTARGFRGGSSQYSADFGGIVTEEERQGVRRIAELDGQMNSAIQAAKQAQRENNWAIFSKQVDLAETRRKELATELASQAEIALEENNKLKERANQVERETAISTLFSSGVTNPADILSGLNTLGYSITAKELDDTLKTLIPEGLSDIIKTANNNGAPQDVITSIASSGSLNDAYTAAGVYGRGGTGIVGEYNRYVADATAAGQTPVSFQEYQNIDANRKAKATASASGMPNQVVTQVDKISASFDSSPIVKQYNEVLNKKQSVEAIVNSGVGGPGDLALVFEFMKALDPTSVVRESEYESASKSGNIFAGAFTRFNKGYFDPKGGILPEEVKNSFLSIVNQKYNVIANQYENLRNEKGRLIEKKTGAYDPNTPGTDYLIDYGAASNTGTDLVATEAQAETKVNEVYSQYQSQIDSLITTNPSITYQDILQVLGIQ